VVIGLIRLFAARQVKVNAVASAGREHLPGAAAGRHRDVDVGADDRGAEHRCRRPFRLADALWYCQDRFKLKLMVDLATLTGAVVVALGSEHAGLFANNETCHLTPPARRSANGCGGCRSPTHTLDRQRRR
jgi:leucyl aminopeptidase